MDDIELLKAENNLLKQLIEHKTKSIEEIVFLSVVHFEKIRNDLSDNNKKLLERFENKLIQKLSIN